MKTAAAVRRRKFRSGPAFTQFRSHPPRRLWGGLTLLTGSAAWATTVLQDGSFDTAGQSIWAPGNAAVNIPSWSYFVGPEWGAVGPVSSGWLPVLPPLPPGTISASASLNAGRLGVEFGVQFTSGSVDVKLPVQLTYDHPAQAQTGQIVNVATSYTEKLTPLLKTYGPGLQAKLDAVIDVGGNVSGTYSPLVGADVSASVDLSTGGEQRINLIKVGSGGTGVSFSFPGVPLGISGNVPDPLNLSTDQYQAGPKLVTGGSTSPFLSLDLDLIGLATTAANAAGIPIPPLSGDLTFAGFGVNYSLISASINMGPKFRQDFEFDVNQLPITLIANTGETHSGKMGDAFGFTMPHGQDLVIDTVVTLDHDFISKSGLAFGADFNFSVLSASLVAAGISVASLGPLYAADPAPIFETSPLYLFDKNFDLQGFNTLDNQLQVQWVPETSTWAAGLVAAGFAGWQFRRASRKHPHG